MNAEHDTQRRRLLRSAVIFLAGVGTALAAIPFLRSWRNTRPLPSEEISLAKMVPGQLMAVTWLGHTIYVLKRTPEMLQGLLRPNSRLADPESKSSEQPDRTAGNLRSLRPEYLVVHAHCTHLGCNVGLIPAGQVDSLPDGGFYCPCHGSWYDYSGRVGRNLPAPHNLVVPPHRFIDDQTLQLGAE